VVGVMKADVKRLKTSKATRPPWSGVTVILLVGVASLIGNIGSGK
jgi:hypothetical protein